MKWFNPLGRLKRGSNKTKMLRAWENYDRILVDECQKLPREGLSAPYYNNFSPDSACSPSFGCLGTVTVVQKDKFLQLQQFLWRIFDTHRHPLQSFPRLRTTSHGTVLKFHAGKLVRGEPITDARSCWLFALKPRFVWKSIITINDMVITLLMHSYSEECENYFSRHP